MPTPSNRSDVTRAALPVAIMPMLSGRSKGAVALGVARVAAMDGTDKLRRTGNREAR